MSMNMKEINAATFDQKWARASAEERKQLLQKRQAQQIAQRRSEHGCEELVLSESDHELCRLRGYDKAIAKFVGADGNSILFCNFHMPNDNE